MAADANQGATVIELGCQQEASDLHSHQWQELLAFVEDADEEQRDNESVVEATGIDQLSRSLNEGQGHA